MFSAFHTITISTFSRTANTASPTLILKYGCSDLRRFPPPWSIEALDCGFKNVDSNGQALAYVGHADQRDAETAKALTLDEARRIASNIAKLPALLGKGS